MVVMFQHRGIYNSNDDIFDNPAIKAIIEFLWYKTFWFRYIEFFLFYYFGLVLLISSIVIYGDDSNKYDSWIIDFIFGLLVIVAIYLFTTRVLKLYYRHKMKRV